MISPEQRQDWDRDGYFFLRGAIGSDRVKTVEREIIERIRADPPQRHPGGAAYYVGKNLLIYPETGASPTAVNPEDYVSRVFNCHAEGLSRRLAEEPQITELVAELLGPDVDCFQSQFIFKNPGVIGQPWHQDSYYFKFDKQPQVGVWVALTEATLDNGCLWVSPGTHATGRIFEHVPDRRPTANNGYVEIVDQDTSGKTPATMARGDVLFFHSYLMHMSTDNVAAGRRSAMVYHYGRAGTKALSPELAATLRWVNRWAPVRRGGAPVVSQRDPAMTEVRPLTRQRRFVTPAPNETLQALAARALPEVPIEAAMEQIRGWNLHVFAMRKPRGLLLGSDIVFVEAPLA